MSEQQYSMATLKAMFAHSTPDRIKFDLIFSATHSERLSCVNDAIDWIAQEHTKTRQHRQDRGEDALTIDIVTDLKAMGFDASHDTQYGGHCDIVIEGKNNFLWLGEAKVHGGYDWLLKGFQQLDTRYSTGLPGQDHGGIIIYFLGQDLAGVMTKWEEHLLAHRTDVTMSICGKNPLVRNSVHNHGRTGLPFYVRHTPINLYFKPDDKKPS